MEVEVTRYVLGQSDRVGAGGTAEMVNALEEEGWASGSEQPSWSSGYNWPDWWHQLNGVGRFHWKVRVEPGKGVDLDYSWHYFWR